MSMIDTVRGKGWLFIGDPHLSSRRPGRRTDENFGKTVLGKVQQALGIAAEHEYIPVFLGDVFDRATENDLELLSGFLNVLMAYANDTGNMPLSLVGNHDKRDRYLSEDTALFLVASCGGLRVLPSGQPVYLADANEKTLAAVLPYSYGDEVLLLEKAAHAKDSQIQEVRERLGSDGTLFALTHANWDFAGAYPGARETIEIPGVDWVVNGHMHNLAPAIRRGGTLWFNPGNITRMDIGSAEHMPRVWAWEPGFATLKGMPLRYEKDIFSRNGRSVDPDRPGLREALQEGGPSHFVQLLQEQKAQGQSTEDASTLLSELRQVYEAVSKENRIQEVALRIVENLIQETLQEHAQ